MSALNYNRMPGPGDFSPPDPTEYDDSAIRRTLASSPQYVEEALLEADLQDVARALMADDPIEVARLLNVAVREAIDGSIAAAIKQFESDPANNRNNPDGETDPFRKLEREYGEQLKRTPLPVAPIVSQATADHFNAIMRGDARPANPFSGLLGGAE